ncbi:hypothetical protein, partial [Escherichia coli]|uniref:hypothetical protein n=1 Tax=Escherichia coli TaxID=562 RepID=UPI003CCAA74E
VPAYGPQNDVTLKMPAFEWVHVQLHQQKGMISLSPPTICNSAYHTTPFLREKPVLRASKSLKKRSHSPLSCLHESFLHRYY